MHIEPLPESAGRFTSETRSGTTCPKCGGVVLVRNWESSCGGYEDEKHTCTVCGHSWWLDGIDS